jgi:hypothetical protein
MDRLRTLAIPRQGHQRTKASRVIVMMVRNENRSNLSQINTSLRNAACGAVAGINDIMRPVNC